MYEMHNPPHPGEVLKDSLLSPDGANLSVTDLAERLHMTRAAVSRVLNGKAGVSPQMAIRLAALLGTSAEVWVRMQVSYDLWKAKKLKQPKIKPLAA